MARLMRLALLASLLSWVSYFVESYSLDPRSTLVPGPSPSPGSRPNPPQVCSDPLRRVLSQIPLVVPYLCSEGRFLTCPKKRIPYKLHGLFRQSWIMQLEPPPKLSVVTVSFFGVLPCFPTPVHPPRLPHPRHRLPHPHPTWVAPTSPPASSLCPWARSCGKWILEAKTPWIDSC